MQSVTYISKGAREASDEKQIRPSMDFAIIAKARITSQSSSEQHSVGQGVSVGVGFELVVVSPLHEAAHCLLSKEALCINSIKAFMRIIQLTFCLKGY